ncbi:MAG: hypothetical protein N3G21_01520 [Candidatus Hydrogenedentes bacterium]|nr:hypothetical protein [Candidatus Hydrogenedentota bacterium]
MFFSVIKNTYDVSKRNTLKRHTNFLFCVVLFFFYNFLSFAEAMQFISTQSQQASPSSKTITNYWLYIKELHDEGNLLRDSISPQRISPKKFPFDLFRELKPNEFLRACREAVDSAKEEGKKNNWTEQEILGKSFENLSLVLEYYCLFVEKSSEVDFLINAITAEQEEKIIRLFLIKQLNSTLPQQSLFSIHFKNLAETRKSEILKMLTTITKRLNEKPEILLEALPYFYSYLYNEYSDVLKKDSVIQAYAYTNNLEITPLILKSQSLPKPLDKTQAELEKLNKSVNEFLIELERMSKSKYPSIEKESKELIEKVLNNFPINKG